MSVTLPPVIGVAGVPGVAAALRELGFTVITGKSFRDAAIAIASQLKQSAIPVVVETMTEPGFTPWVLATHAKSAGVIILPTSDDVDLSGELAGVPQLALPSTVNGLLEAVGLTPGLAAAGDVVIASAGHDVAPVAAPVVADAVDPFAVMVAAAAPVVDPLPVADPFSVTDPFSVADPFVVADPFDAPAPQTTNPLPVTDPFSAADPLSVSDPFVVADPLPVTDPFVASGSPDVGPAGPTSPDAFEAMLALAAPGSTTAPEVISDPLAHPLDTPLGVPNPAAVDAPAAFDPFAGSSISGDDVADFLDAVAEVTEATESAELLPVIPVAPATPVVPVASEMVSPSIALPADELIATPVADPFANIAESVPEAAPAPAPAVAVAPVAEPVAPVVPLTPRMPANAPPQSDFIRQVLARSEVRPAASAPAEPSDFFHTPGISAGGCQVIISLAGKGGAGKTTQTLMYGQTAGAAGLRVLVIDANRDQGDIGTSLRIDKADLPSILHAVDGNPSDAIVSKERINAARPAAAQDIEFDVVLAPPRALAGPRYASAQVYAKVLAYAKTRYEVIVIDTQIVEAQKSDLHTGFIIPELRSGAWSAGIALYDYSAIRNAFSVFDELSALGVTAQRTLVVATRWPERERDLDRFEAQFGQYGTFVGFVGDDPNVNAQKSVGNLTINSPAIAPVASALLHRVTGNAVFAPAVEQGRRARKSANAQAPKRERRGLFGARR